MPTRPSPSSSTRWASRSPTVPPDGCRQMELILVRHAEPRRVGAGEVDGPADPGLTDRGRQQAERLAAWLAVEPVDAVITSPLRRARETAAPVASALGLT